VLFDMSYFCLLYTTWYNEPISNKKARLTVLVSCLLNSSF